MCDIFFQRKIGKCKSSYAIGYAHVNGKLLNNSALAKYFSNLNQYEVKEQIENIQGFFVLVIEFDDCVILVTDQIRSFPLFYAIENDNVYISDSSNMILDKLPKRKTDITSKLEFLSYGYVTGSNTLDEQISQVQAGEIVTIKKQNREILTEQYFKYLPKTYSKKTGKALLEEWKTVWHEAIKRMLEYVNGRTIVIPLSGGYDSRLIALTLKELKYENVICFSYGREGNWEASVSKQIAEQLGYKWEFAQYTHDKCKKWYYSSEHQNYKQFAQQLVSLAHFQDFPAVLELKKNKLIPEDSVFVPGHSGDLLGGSCIPVKLNKRNIRFSDLQNHIFETNMLWKFNDLSKFTDIPRKEVKKLILTKLGYLETEYSIDNFKKVISVYEYWFTTGKVSKLVSNSVRVYEYFEYEWSLPFWDKSVTKFWLDVPIEYKIGKATNSTNMYDSYINILSNKLGVTFLRKPKTRINNIIRRFFPRIAINVVRKLLSKRLYNSDSDFKCVNGIFPLHIYHKNPENVNGLAVLEALDLIDPAWQKEIAIIQQSYK